MTGDSPAERRSAGAGGQPSQSPRRPWKPPTPPTVDEIHAALDSSAFPPILTVHQAAALLQVSHHTIYKAVSEGRYKDSVRRGKPLRFWRDRLVRLFFSK